MSQQRLTDERLRHWMNADQYTRETFCAGILQMDPRVSQVRPRHPAGGRDGGRDVEAVVDGKDLMVCAAGFKNNASDSDRQRAEIVRKFKEDLDAAVAYKPGLRAFAFFTNVEPQGAERDEMEGYARAAGVGTVDLYYRSRLALLLNDPRGFALRFQALQIGMEAAEQATFFANYGQELNDVLTGQHQAVRERLDRLEFLHAMSRPLGTLELGVRFKREQKAADLGPFRFLAELGYFNSRRTAVYLGATDAYSERAGGAPSFGHRDVFSFDHRKIDLKVGLEPTVHIGVTIGMTLAHAFERNPGAATPEMLDGRVLHLYATPGLSTVIQSVRLSANGYLLLELEGGEIHWQPAGEVVVPWPEQLAAAGAGQAWQRGGSRSFWPAEIDFGRLPRKPRTVP